MEDNMITIRNLTTQPKNFVLPHQSVCVKLGKCLCVNGHPSSLHVLAKRGAETFRAALNAPMIQKALSRKQIAIGPAKKKKKAEAASAKPKSDGDTGESSGNSSGKGSGKGSGSKKK